MIREKCIPLMFVASTEHFVNHVSDDLIEQFTNDFEKHLLETTARKVEPPNFFTVFHVDEYRDNDYHMELWVQVEELQKGTHEIQFKSVPESEVAYIMVSENYDNLKSTYDSLFAYIKEKDYIVNGYPRETYLFDDNAPYGYFTEIQLPFTRKTL